MRCDTGAARPPLALRVEYAGKVIAYSGDTEWTDALIDVAKDADLFVCECNFYDRKAPGHLDYMTLIEKHSQIQVRADRDHPHERRRCSRISARPTSKRPPMAP